MKSVWRFLTSRWFLSFVGAAILAALVWFGGLLTGLLESVIIRAAICAAIVMIWALANFLLDRRRRRTDQALADGVAAVTPADTARAEEVAAMRDKLSTALALLRRASGTRGYLYEQPWYVMIGPPGAGKTTALLNAGLKFPLAAEMGQGAVAGVGGTRMCDWWFTEQAVLIDTAGRYTTQDSDATVDRAGWEGFLDLLRRTRPQQPLNGVLVAIGAPDLAQASQPERLDHARAIRRRIKELTEKLGLRLPVYALFTKTDLLAGFSEYFDDLDRAGREQVWGHTFALQADAGPAGPIAGWAEALRGLVSRLNGRLVDRLQAERSPERRALLAGFPAQMASLESPLGEFLAEAFGGSRLDPAPLLRGVYFTSGTQAGTPIDRLTGSLARSFGLDQQRAASLRPQQGRSYFLGGLLRVVFGEAMLGSARPGAARQLLLLRWGALAGILVVTLGLAAAILAGRAREQANASRMADALAKYEGLAASLRLDPVTDGDLRPVAPLLDAARDLPFGAGEAEPGRGLGLSQARKYAKGARSLYQNALDRVLLPRLLVRLEQQMRENRDNPNILYELTRVYLMLGGQGPMDADSVRVWEEQVDWPKAYADPALRTALARHLDALLAAPLPAVALDGGLINDARAIFAHVDLAKRVYIKLKAEGQGLPPWVPADHVGASGVAVFVRPSGKPLSDGIPGFYTVEGFHGLLLKRVWDVARDVAGESWVLGSRTELDPNSAAMLTLRDQVIRLYETDYEHAWDALLHDLTVKPLGGPDSAALILDVLSSPQSPLRDLLTAIARELTLSRAPEGVAGEGAVKVPGALGSAAARLAALMPQESQAPPGHAVDEYYAGLRKFVGSGPGAPIDTMLGTLDGLKKSVPAPGGGGGAPASGSGAAAQELKAQAIGAPAPLAGMMNSLAGGSTAIVGGSARAALVNAYNGPDGPAALCAAAVDGKYPFTRGSEQNIPLEDFGRLFAPGGQLDSFFKAQVAPFVETGRGGWRLRPLEGVAPPLTAGELAPFRQAVGIRDLFFAGGAGPGVRFDIETRMLDNVTKQVTLALGDTRVTYEHGPLRFTTVTWPGQGMDDVRLSFDPPPASGGVVERQGPWALFRFVDAGTLTQGTSRELYDLAFSAGDRAVQFELRAHSVLNPFAPGVLQGFHCPALQ